MSDDRFGTAELRRRVVDAWRASPARFRADANLEEDAALVGYRDRVVVELAQNAADAATRAGRAGRLELRLDGAVLSAANTGSPLDAAGVESIAVARASAKVDQRDTAGRYGVGFAAVLSVTDAPGVASRLGGARWSREAARAEVARAPELAGELASRDEHVPMLRLPFPAAGLCADEPEPFDTVVTLPLRDAAAVAAVREQLDRLDATIFFALPALAEIVLRTDGTQRVLTVNPPAPWPSSQPVETADGRATSRWHIASGAGRLPTRLLADRPVEERRRDEWQVRWALPVDASGRLVELPERVDRVVRAPTPADDAVTLPAVLVASYPLDAMRRRVTPGALADAVSGHAADVLLAALRELPADPSMLALVPAGFPDGELDAALHAAVRDRMSATAWLPTAADAEVRQRPAAAVVVADELVDVLRDVVPGLLPAGWSRPQLTALEVRRPELAEVVAAPAGLQREPAWWQRLYAALDRAVPAGPEREALTGLPVPLADGSLAVGPRGLLLPDPAQATVDLVPLGIRLAHPDAVHPLLERLGAVVGTARDVLELPSVRAAVEASYDEDDPAPLAAALLGLLARSGADAAELPWLADLALTDRGGDWRPAGELVMPGGLMASLIAADSAFGVLADRWVDEHGADTLRAVGVVDAPAVLRAVDAVDATHDLDDEAGWWAGLPVDAVVPELVAVRDLEQVRDDALPDLLTWLASTPATRPALVEPTVVTSPAGRQKVQPYTAWWLGRRPVVDGRLPTDIRLPGSDPRLAGLYDVTDSRLDLDVLRALGVLDRLDDADPDDVLARLADPTRPVARHQLRALDAWLSERDVRPPAAVRAVRGGEVVVVPATDAVVIDAPDLAALLGGLAVVPVAARRAAALAERLDLPLASEVAGGCPIVSTGRPRDDVVVHDRLLVRDVDGEPRQLAWRWADGVLHVDRGQWAYGVGRGTAWRDGAWSQRHRRTEASSEPGRVRIHDDEDDFDEPREAE